MTKFLVTYGYYNPCYVEETREVEAVNRADADEYIRCDCEDYPGFRIVNMREVNRAYRHSLNTVYGAIKKTSAILNDFWNPLEDEVLQNLKDEYLARGGKRDISIF